MASKSFLERTMVKNEPVTLQSAGGASMSSKRVHRETQSALDSTVYRGTLQPGVLALKQDKEDIDFRASGGFTHALTTRKPNTQDILLSHTGTGGTANFKLSQETARKKKDTSNSFGPPKAHARTVRANPPNTELRRYYERSDLPCLIVQAAKNSLKWKVNIYSLDYHHYLPIFVSGLREVEEPYRFIAEEGVYDLIRAGGEAKVFPVIPQLILPLKEALATRDEAVMKRTLKVIGTIASLGPAAGASLIPYYRQLLPIFNLFISQGHNIGQNIDYGQRFGRLSDIITETLNRMEINGGPDALINIKLLVPTYESAVLG